MRHGIFELADGATPERAARFAATIAQCWVAGDGISDKYQLGAEVTHNGLTWTSTHNGQNTWAPGVFGWVVSEGDG